MSVFGIFLPFGVRIVYGFSVEYEKTADQGIVDEIFREDSVTVLFTESLFYPLFLRGGQFDGRNDGDLCECTLVFAVGNDQIFL